MKVSDQIRDYLAKAKADGNVLYLPPGQLDRKDYEAVNKILAAAGGKWNKQKRGHVFEASQAADVLAAVLDDGEVVDRKKELQFFQTPTDLAKFMVDRAEIASGMRVLEPSAGHGAIAIQIGYRWATALLHMCEIDPYNRKRLDEIPSLHGKLLVEHNFLECWPERLYDRIVANPPFSKGQDIDHVLHMIECCTGGGRIVTVMSGGIPFRSDRRTSGFRDLVKYAGGQIDTLPAGTFSSSGTDAAAVLVTLNLPPTGSDKLANIMGRVEALKRKESTVDKKGMSKQHGPAWIDEKNPPPAGRIYHLDGDEGDVLFLGLTDLAHPTRDDCDDGGLYVAATYADKKLLLNAESELRFTVDEWNANWGDDQALTFDDADVQVSAPMAKAIDRLEWTMGNHGGSAQSIAYGSTEGGLYYRVRKAANRWRIADSDNELIANLPKARFGPYPTLDDAKRVCQEIDDAIAANQSTDSTDSTDDTENADGPCVGRFNPANPWPEGSVIVFSDGGPDRILVEVDLENLVLTIKGDGCEEGATYGFTEWNADWADKVEEVRFPEAAAAVNQQSNGQSMKSQSFMVEKLPPPSPSIVDISLVDVIHNIRPEIDQTLLPGLGSSMIEDGQDAPVVLCETADGRYRLMDGERRYRAAMQANIKKLRAEVYGELSESQILLYQVRSFGHKQALDHRGWAQAYKSLQEATGWSAAEMGRRAGQSDDHVRKHLDFLELYEFLQQQITDGVLSLNKALSLQKVHHTQAADLAARQAAENWSEKRVSDEVAAILRPTLPGMDTPSEETATIGDVTVGGLCRCCGCTDEQGCGADVSGWESCGWSDAAHTICTFCSEEDGKRQALRVLARHGLDVDLVDKLEAAHIETIGDLAELTRRRGTFWWRDLEDLHGFGEAATGKLDDALAKFHFARMGTGNATAEHAEGAEGGNPQSTIHNPQSATPPADNKWKVTGTSKLKIAKETADSLVKAGLWCAGLVWDRSQKMGAGWHQGAGLDLSDGQAEEVIAAIHLLWPAPATDAFDQVNQRRVDKVNEAPIKGTRADTQRERDAQARADSDRAEAAKPKVAIRLPSIAAKLTANGNVGVDGKGQAYISLTGAGCHVTIFIGGKPLKVKMHTLMLCMDEPQLKLVAAAWDVAEKKRLAALNKKNKRR